jgi:hypothetical protein
LPFKQMENISAFLRWVKTTEVRDFDLFTTNACFTGDNMKQVVQCLHSLARAAAEIAGFSGPFIDANKLVEEVVTKKRGTFQGVAPGGPQITIVGGQRHTNWGPGKIQKDTCVTKAAESSVFGGQGNNAPPTVGAIERDQKGVPDMFLRKHVTSGAAPPPKFEKAVIKPTEVVFLHEEKTVYVKALHAFKARDDTELSIQPGDIIEVLSKEDEGWWEGSRDGKTGLFPGN